MHKNKKIASIRSFFEYLKVSFIVALFRDKLNIQIET